MIVSGEPISAAEALKSGLVDEIIDGSSTTAGETFARTILAGKIPMRRLRDDDTKLLAAGNDRMIFTNAVAAVTKRNRGLQPRFRLPKRSVEPPRSVRRGADARTQCVPQIVSVSIRSNNVGLSCTNTSHNRDYKTFRQLKRAILKFLKHTIPGNWNRLCVESPTTFRVIHRDKFRVVA
jgi:hypothetical protein